MFSSDSGENYHERTVIPPSWDGERRSALEEDLPEWTDTDYDWADAAESIIEFLADPKTLIAFVMREDQPKGVVFWNSRTHEAMAYNN